MVHTTPCITAQKLRQRCDGRIAILKKIQDSCLPGSVREGDIKLAILELRVRTLVLLISIESDGVW